MSRSLGKISVIAFLFGTLVCLPVFAGRGGRGGGGMSGGGGGMRGGMGGGMGGGQLGGRPGGGSHSPSFSSPRPSPGGGARPGGGGVGREGGGQLGGGRPSTLPNGPQFGGRPGGGPSGIRERPGGSQGAGRPDAGIANRPGIDSRPGGGQGGIANRPGIDSRPGTDQRPRVNNNIGNNVIAGNRTAINQGNANINNIQPGRGVDPGFGVRPPAYNNWRGAYWDNHRSWVNGYWHGYHNSNNWNWGSYALGATTGVAAWGLGSSLYNWGYASYANPYYGATAPVIVQPVAGTDAQPAPVAQPVYDYSQPIDAQAPPPEASVTEPALATFDSARESFKAGNYAEALRLTEQALSKLPNDATLHEFRALCLFALQQYEQAAAPLYAVLSVGPGWDWTTLASLYPSVNVYTEQLRALEDFTKANPNSAGGHFVQGYHYLTQGHVSEAVDQFKKVVALAPADTLSAQLVKQFSGTAVGAAAPQEAPPSSPAPVTVAPGSVAGNWKANPNKNTSIDLKIAEDGPFTWKVTSNGKTQEIKGDWSLTGDVLTLAQQNQGGVLVGNVSWEQANQFVFRVVGAGATDAGLTFTR